ncbi:hypothetical protein ACWDG1_46410 [Streptomyces sp. NPDC001177]
MKKKKAGFVLSFGIATAAVASLVSPPSAQAAGLQGRVVSQRTGQCLVVGAGDVVQLGPCRSDTAKWEVPFIGRPDKFRNVRLNRCLDTDIFNHRVFLSPCDSATGWSKTQWAHFHPADSEQYLVGWNSGGVSSTYDKYIDNMDKTLWMVVT